MTAVLEFESHHPVRGYRVVDFDRRKLVGVVMTEDYRVEPPPGATDDERRAFKLWGYMSLTPGPGEKEGVIHLLIPEPGKVMRFDLLNTAPAAFLDFAHTPTTHQGVNAFANRYGSISGSVYAEEVEHWYPEIRQMRRALSAWDQAREMGDFGQIIRMIARRSRAHLGLSKWRGIDVTIRLKADRATGSARLCIRPNDLLEALWVQLALAVDGRQNFRPCSECGEWFPISSGENRSDREYCSDACRMRAYRKRKAASKRSNLTVS